MVKAVVFDLDGTLLDTIWDIASAMNRSLTARGWPTRTVEECKACVGGGILTAFRRALPPGTDEAEVLAINAVHQQDYPKNCAVETRPFPGIEELLQTLVERNVPVGVLTNKTDGTAQFLMGRYFPDIPWKCVQGRIEGCPLKPDAAAAAPMLARMGLQPGQIAYVGDSGVDITFARNVGMVPVGVSWGYRSREELAECGAVHIADNGNELKKILLELLG